MPIVCKEKEVEQGMERPRWDEKWRGTRVTLGLTSSNGQGSQNPNWAMPSTLRRGGGGVRKRSVHPLTLKSLATAMPRAAEMEVELCPAPKGSYSLSERLVKPDMPPVCLMVGMRDLLPVRILCG